MTDHSVTSQEQQPDATRWRRLPEERPAQILQAALEVFGEHGLAAARLDDIARRAGLSKGTIYLYFESKEALFREAIQQTIVARLDLAEGHFTAEDGNASDQLTAFFRWWWAMLSEPAYATITRLVQSELHRFPDLHQYYADTVVRRASNLLAGMINRGIAAGEFRPMETEMATRLCISVFLSHALWRSQVRTFKTLPADEIVVVQCIDFVLHALRPAAPAAALTADAT
jgi:AcrR family transcriptional regulator